MRRLGGEGLPLAAIPEASVLSTEPTSGPILEEEWLTEPAQKGLHTYPVEWHQRAHLSHLNSPPNRSPPLNSIPPP